jgi:hypothetical protein
VVIEKALLDGLNDPTWAVSELSNHTSCFEPWKAMPDVWVPELAHVVGAGATKRRMPLQVPDVVPH